jgi:menaquinone-dependent protoporphyrinogen oxidase
MCDVPVLYATSEGQTRRIAERIAQRLRQDGVDAKAILIDSSEAARIDWDHIRGVCVGASLHAGRHQASAVAFARRYKQRLLACPSLFFSVSLAAASKNPSEVAEARRIAESFATLTGWQPQRIACIAGRLAYTQYGWLTRWFMRRIALKEGESGDTSRDYEYTDWNQVVTLADDLIHDIRRREHAAIRATA